MFKFALGAEISERENSQTFGFGIGRPANCNFRDQNFKYIVLVSSISADKFCYLRLMKTEQSL